MKELDLKLTLGMAERQLTESPPDEESWGGGQWFKSRPDPKVTLSQMSRLFIGILHIAAVVIVRTINSRAKKNKERRRLYQLCEVAKVHTN